MCAIKAPGFGDNRRANLEDLAILTGGEVRETSVSSFSYFMYFNIKFTMLFAGYK